VYPYVVASVERRPDGGFAQFGTSPNFQGGVITLCACKHHMRSGARFRDPSGVWVAGISGAGVGGTSGRHLVYLMLVELRADSQAEMWERLEPDTREAKSASRHPLGDLYEPLRPVLAGDARYRVHHYRPPCIGHVHAAGSWYSDIDIKYGSRRPVLLAGDPAQSWLWSRPAIRAGMSRHRAGFRGPRQHRTRWLVSLTGFGRRAGAEMQVVLLRVGIDSAAGGIQGPLFADGTFELVPIPDVHHVDERTYGNSIGRNGRPFIHYFPERLRPVRVQQPMHVDPEFDTFTYGDPTTPKRGLRRLAQEDLLVFYAGLEPWPNNHSRSSTAALYIIGYFEVTLAGFAPEFSDQELHAYFASNAHVRNAALFHDQRDRLLLIKGDGASKLLDQAVLVSEISVDSAGRPLKVISQPMRQVFGNFGGQNSLQRSNPRWVDTDYVDRAADFVRSLT
jgi:Nucleotide modification associated domain 3